MKIKELKEILNSDSFLGGDHILHSQGVTLVIDVLNGLLSAIETLSEKVETLEKAGD